MAISVPHPTSPDAGSGSLAQRSLSGWVDPVLIRRRGPSHGRTVVTVVIVALLAFMEAGVLAPLLQVVVLMTEWESWGVSWLIAVISAYTMHLAGRRHAGFGPHRAGDGRGLTILVVVAWLAVGLVVTGLRVVGLSMSTDIQGLGQDRVAGLPVGDGFAALVFLLLYVMAGLIAFAHGMDRNDAHTALVLAETEWASVQEALEFWESQLLRVACELDRRHADVARVERWAETERDLSVKLRDASLARVRTEIGRVKADPAVMGIASLRHPDHPGHPE